MDCSRRRVVSLPLGLLPQQWACASPVRQSNSAGVSGDRQTYKLNIPTQHPRIWFTPERLAAARAWYSPSRFRQRRDDYAGYAFRHLMRRDTAAARTAIGWAMNLVFDTSRTSSNEARWFGESAILIYDWAHDQFTAAERETFVQRWNGYVAALAKKSWGGPEMPQSNYFWGYFRNELLWAIATYHENPMAQAILEHAMSVRWQKSFLPHAAGPARGGVPLEGSQYGRYLLQYACTPLMTAHLAGRAMFDETAFFREALYWLIHATTPAPTVPQAGGAARWETFPFGDDQFFRNGGSAESLEYGAFASTLASSWPERPAGQLARRWLRNTAAERPHFVAAVEGKGPEKEFSSLPLDYFAPGAQHVFARTSWERDATALHLQLGAVSGGSHEHADHGNWQIWRKGRWLSRETTGYSNRFAGYSGRGPVEAYHTVVHNTLLVNGSGLALGYRNGPPVLKCLESQATYLHAAVDLTPSYRNDRVASHRPERDNPAAASVEREFVFIRPLETLVIFDRLRSRGNAPPAAEVVKTFLAHFEHPPVLDGPASVLGANGDQALRLITLLPAKPVRRVIAEGSPIGQHRLEVDDKGSEQSCFLHVLQARGASDPDVMASLAGSGEEYTLTLAHPKRGFARLLFRKESSAGSGMRFSTTAVPSAVSPFLNRVQQIRVTEAGPEWEAVAKSDDQGTARAGNPPGKK